LRLTPLEIREPFEDGEGPRSETQRHMAAKTRLGNHVPVSIAT
jgi:hypothetical protein